MNWSVSKQSKFSHRIEFEYDRSIDWDQWVLLTTDRHWDNPKSNHKLQKKHLDEALRRNAPVIDAGDLFCAMQGNKDRRATKSDIRPEHMVNDYFDALVNTAHEFFEPYKDIWAVQGIGNHETAILKHNEIDLLRRFCVLMDCELGGYGGYVKFRFKRGKARKEKTLKYFHGSGGGGPVTKGVIQTNRRSTYLPDADIIFTGHIHEQWQLRLTRERLNKNGEIYFEDQLHVQGPTYKEEHGTGGWHDQRGAPPKPIGAWWLQFYNDGYDNLAYRAIEA